LALQHTLVSFTYNKDGSTDEEKVYLYPKGEEEGETTGGKRHGKTWRDMERRGETWRDVERRGETWGKRKRERARERDEGDSWCPFPHGAPLYPWGTGVQVGCGQERREDREEERGKIRDGSDEERGKRRREGGEERRGAEK
jgi:hypothetical protein